MLVSEPLLTRDASAGIAPTADPRSPQDAARILLRPVPGQPWKPANAQDVAFHQYWSCDERLVVAKKLAAFITTLRKSLTLTSQWRVPRPRHRTNVLTSMFIPQAFAAGDAGVSLPAALSFRQAPRLERPDDAQA